MSRIKDIHVCLLIVGSGSMRQELEVSAKAQKINHRFCEHIKNVDLYKYYALADVFVLPSITTQDFKEPWGLVINEAMNQSCPIIATTAVGAAEGGLVEQGKNGFVVFERSSGELAKAIREILSDDDLRQRMGQYSKNKIKDWTIEKSVEDLENVIGKFLNKKQ